MCAKRLGAGGFLNVLDWSIVQEKVGRKGDPDAL